MRKILVLLVILINTWASAQVLKEMNPVLGKLIDKNPQGEIDFNKRMERLELIGKKVTSSQGESQLTEEEKRFYHASDFESEVENYWDVIGVGCSWYCGGGQDTATASSELKSAKGFRYAASNIDDLSYKTAWIEGVSGYGIGESITLHFPPENPRITKIIIVNGYVKSEKTWLENARVKKLKMYLFGKPFAILNLEDTRREQEFSFEPIGYKDRKNWEQLKQKPWWTMKFEIMEVYKGDKNEDTAITEIYFDGIDVHCLSAGTQITMSDNSLRNIETIKAGDFIKTYDFASKLLVNVPVTQLVSVVHNSIVKLTLSDRTVFVTDDHPFWTEHKQWASLNPVKSNTYYKQQEQIMQLKIGDRIFLPAENGFTTLKSVEIIKRKEKTYTLDLQSGAGFIANGLLVKTETL